MTVCTEFIQPLNLQCLLVNTFAETSDIFLAISLFALAALAGYFRMQTGIFFVFLGVFLVMIASFFGPSPFLFLLLTIGSMLLFLIISRLFKT